MKESYRKGPASHPGPESCVGRRKAAGEALTGAHVGPVLSCEINPIQGADVVTGGGRRLTSSALPTSAERSGGAEASS